MNQATAFPYVAKFCIGHDANNAPIYDEDSFPGMNLRDYFAAQALGGYCATCEVINTARAAQWCYEMADAMMLARENKQ